MAPLDVAWGIHDIVNENMASGARIHIAEKSHDPRDFTFVATGGADYICIATEVARKKPAHSALCWPPSRREKAPGPAWAYWRRPRARRPRLVPQPALLEDIDWRGINANGVGRLYPEGRVGTGSFPARAARGRCNVTIGAEMRCDGQGDNVPVSLPWQEVFGGGAGPNDAPGIRGQTSPPPPPPPPPR